MLRPTLCITALLFPLRSLMSAILLISQANPLTLLPSSTNSLVLQSMATITSLSHQAKTCATGSGWFDGPTTKNPPIAVSISSVLVPSPTVFFVYFCFSPPLSDIITVTISLSFLFSPLTTLSMVTVNTSKMHFTFEC